jgi:UDP-N-acetylglucosamine 2-epimerase (non-hydrolysing)
MKVMTIVGTRPEIIRLSEIIKLFDNNFEHILVHTGQNYDYNLNQIFFDELGIRTPNEFLNVASSNLGETLGNIIEKAYNVLKKHTPDALLILGDTNSSLAAIPAKRLKIPIFHMEAGNRCFDENLPEEINRRIVDHISDVNLPYTEHARRYLLNEGIKGNYIFVTGSPMKEVIANNYDKISSSDILHKLNLKKNEYLVLSLHREENLDNEMNLNSLIESIEEISRKFGYPIIFSTHPRTKKKIKENNVKFSDNIRLLEPFGFHDYNKLQEMSFCVISDSGTLPEESYMLNFPAVSIRTSTERPEALEKGAFVVSGLKYNNVIESIQLVTKNNHSESNIKDYEEHHVSQIVLKVIQSYTSVINNMIWRK